MEISEAQYQRIAHCLPVQRGNVRLANRQVLNAMLYVAEHGCKWRGLPPHDCPVSFPGRFGRTFTNSIGLAWLRP